MPTCTLPKIPYFRDWYNEQFKDLCQAHDDAYRLHVSRKIADIDLMVGLCLRGYVVLGIATYLVVRIFGWTHYRKASQNNVV